MTQVKKMPSKRAEAQKKVKLFQRGEQKIKLDIHRERPILPPLPLPYPPATRVEKIVEKLISKPKLARFPNAFIMYRNEYVQFLKASGLNFPMTELSPMISYSWKQEPPCVKDAYTQISSEAERLYVQTIAMPKDSNNNQDIENQYHDNYFSEYNTFLGMPSPTYFLESCENITNVQTNSTSSPESPWLSESYEHSTIKPNNINKSIEQGDNDDTLMKLTKLTNQGSHTMFDGQPIDWTNVNEFSLSSLSRRSSESSNLSSCDIIHLMNVSTPLFPENLPLPIFDNLGQFDDQSFFTPTLDNDSLSSQYDSNPQTPGSPFSSSSSSINDNNELSEITIDIFSAIDCALSFKLYANNDF